MKQYGAFRLSGASDRARYHYAFFSANLHRFLPNIPWAEHVNLFKEMSLNQALSQLDMHFAPVLINDTLEAQVSDLVERLKAKPGIVVTFHMGSYRLLNFLLANAGLSFSLVVSSHTYKKEGEAFRTGFRYLGGSSGDFNLIKAEEPHALLAMLRALKRGHSLLLYMDGNTGTPALFHQLEEINLLGRPFFVRKGIPYLAHLAQVPLYPILAEGLSEAFTWKVLPAIDPIGVQDSARFIAETCQRLYGLLQEALLKHPGQWTCWPFIHQYMGPWSAISIAGKRSANPEHWEVFKMDGYRYLFDKVNYQFYNVNGKQYEKWVKNTINV